MFKAGKKLTFIFAITVLVSSMTMAARIRDRVVAPIPSVDATGMPDIVNTGTGIVKGVYNTRNGVLRAVVRGVAPNLSGRNAVFKNNVVIANAIANEVQMTVAIPPGAVPVLNKGVYRVSKRGVVSGSGVGGLL